MNGTCLLGWGKGGGSMVCRTGGSNLFSCHWQLKGEEYEGRSRALILDALKEFLDLFAVVVEGFLLWPSLLGQGRRAASQLVLCDEVEAVDGEPKGSSTLHIFHSLTLFISGSAVHECQQSAVVWGSILSPYWSYHNCQADQQSCKTGRPLRIWFVYQTSITCCAILCASARPLQN